MQLQLVMNEWFYRALELMMSTPASQFMLIGVLAIYFVKTVRWW